MINSHCFAVLLSFSTIFLDGVILFLLYEIDLVRPKRNWQKNATTKSLSHLIGRRQQISLIGRLVDIAVVGWPLAFSFLANGVAKAAADPNRITLYVHKQLWSAASAFMGNEECAKGFRLAFGFYGECWLELFRVDNANGWLICGK